MKGEEQDVCMEGEKEGGGVTGGGRWRKRNQILHNDHLVRYLRQYRLWSASVLFVCVYLLVCLHAEVATELRFVWTFEYSGARETGNKLTDWRELDQDTRIINLRTG